MQQIRVVRRVLPPFSKSPATRVGKLAGFQAPVVLMRANGNTAGAQRVGQLSVGERRKRKTGKGYTHDAAIQMGKLVEHMTISVDSRAELLAGKAIKVWVAGHEWAMQIVEGQ
jgi:hypothetical protein